MELAGPGASGCTWRRARRGGGCAAGAAELLTRQRWLDRRAHRDAAAAARSPRRASALACAVGLAMAGAAAAIRWPTPTCSEARRRVGRRPCWRAGRPARALWFAPRPARCRRAQLLLEAGARGARRRRATTSRRRDRSLHRRDAFAAERRAGDAAAGTVTPDERSARRDLLGLAGDLSGARHGAAFACGAAALFMTGRYASRWRSADRMPLGVPSCGAARRAGAGRRATDCCRRFCSRKPAGCRDWPAPSACRPGSKRQLPRLSGWRALDPRSHAPGVVGGAVCSSAPTLSRRHRSRCRPSCRWARGDGVSVGAPLLIEFPRCAARRTGCSRPSHRRSSRPPSD